MYQQAILASLHTATTLPTEAVNQTPFEIYTQLFLPNTAACRTILKNQHSGREHSTHPYLGLLETTKAILYSYVS